jgi:phosphoribosylformylglycinamidine cyclo-ligase
MNYKDSGVDLHEQDMFNARLCQKMPWLGGFAGALDIGNDYLVSSTDGVGTKVKLYVQAQEEEGVSIKNIGIDLVAMVMNDIVCCGAKPLFFNDYLAVNQLSQIDALGLIEGINEGLKQCGDNVPLLGGETAIMTDMYKEGDFDIAGFGVGACPKDDFIDGSGIVDGDVMIGLKSDGFHSNGYTLIRKVIESEDTEDIPFSDLLRPTKIYVKPVLEVVNKHKGKVHGIAHITGGGRSNVDRLLGEDINLRPVWFENQTLTEEMEWIKMSGQIDELEFRKVFNNGIGMVLIVDREEYPMIQDTLDGLDVEHVEIGAIGSRIQN